MTSNSKYVFYNGGNFLDLDLDYPSVSLTGQSVQVVGTSDIDRVFVRPGTTVDFVQSGGGSDKLYLEGNLADYSFSVAGTVLQVTRGSGSTLELATLSGSSTDVLVFANGTVTATALRDYAISLAASTSSTPVAALPLPVPGGETSLAPVVPVSYTSSAKFVAYGATTFVPVEPGIDVTLVGSGGVDKVYVKAGSTVNAVNLGGSQDLVFFTGTWADYSKSTIGTQLVFERDINGHHERVTVSQGNVANADKLIFADGAAGSFTAGAAIRDATTAGVPVPALATLSDYDVATFTPGTAPHLPLISLVAGEDAWVNAAEIAVDVQVAYGNIRAGDTIQMKLGTANAGVPHTVTAAEALAGAAVVSVAKASLGADGVKHLVASIVGLGGSALSDELVLTVDTVAPLAPTLAASHAQMNGDAVASASGAVSVQAEAGSVVQVVFTSGPNSLTKSVTGTGAAQAVMLGAADVALLGNGTVAVSALATDAAGNVSNAGTTTFTLDTIAPGAPTINVVACDDVINAAEQSALFNVSGTTEAGSTVALHFGTRTVAAVVTGTTWTYAAQAADVAQLGQGSATITAVSTDAANNVSLAASHAVVVDTIGPQATTVARATTANVDASGNTNSHGLLDFVVTFNDASVVNAALPANWIATLNGTALASAVTSAQALGGGQFRITVDASTIGAVDGLLTVTLAPVNTVVDVSGNPATFTTNTSPSFSYVIDHLDVAPTFAAATRSVSVVENTPSSTVLFAGGATDADLTAPNNTLTYSVAGTDAALFNIDTSSGAVSFVASPDFETAAHGGHYQLTLVATDGAGRSALQAVSIDVTDANDAPVVGTVIANQTIGVGQAFAFAVPAGAFVDADAAGTANHTLTYSATLAGGAALPAWLHFDSSTATFTGTPPGAAHVEVTVTATDGGQIPLSASQSFGIDALPALVLSTSLNGVANFDVTSPIVLTASESVTAVAGKYIHVVDGGGSVAGIGYGGENTVHTQDILVTDASQVQIVGGKIIINPSFDLDLSSHYSITVDAGAFTGATTHLSSAAVDASAIGFDTVTPTGGPGSLVTSAAPSQAFDATTGLLHASYGWWNIEGVGNTITGVNADLSTGKVAMVFKDWNVAGGDASAGTDGVGVKQSFWVNATGFGVDDLLYIDDQSNQPLQANLLAWTAVNHNGTQPVRLAFDAAPTIGTEGQAWVDISLAGTPAVFGSISALNDLLATSSSAVVSA